jgi:uncharacterized protein (PEP-CTERM system associated)
MRSAATRPRKRALLAGALVAGAALDAAAANVTIQPAVRTRATVTDNVNLAPRGSERSDVYLEVSPSIGLRRTGPRLRFDVGYQFSGYLHAREEAQDDSFHNLRASATAEAIDNFLWIDAGANVNQQFFSPIGAQPGDLGLQSANRYTSYSYFVSPYIRGVLPREVQYGLRYRASWSDSNQAVLAAARVEEISGTMDSPTRRFGWGLDAYAQRTTFRDQEPLEQSLVRGRLNYSVNPDLIATLRLGYERNDYAFADYSGEIYGAGVDWRPTPRTSVNGFWEERFFGSSYALDVSHRRRLHAVQLGFSRSTTTYTQQLLSLPAGNTLFLLDAALTSRFPDPVERQAAIERFLQQTGLPPTLTSPQAFYTQQILLQERAYASWAIQGVRNAVVFTYSWLDQTPITAAGALLPPELTPNQNFTQQRLAVSYTRRLSGRTSFNALGDGVQSRSRIAGTFDSDQYLLRLLLSTELSRHTSAFAGARYQRFDATDANSYREKAGFVGITYLF